MEAYDSFTEKNEKLEEKFAKGGIFGKDSKKHVTIESVENIEVMAEIKNKRGAKERPETPPKDTKEDSFNYMEYKSDMISFIHEMCLQQKEMELEEKREKKEEERRKR